MKKITKILLAFVLVFSMTSVVFANGKGPITVKKTHNIDASVLLIASSAEVSEGEIVNLTALTPKYGSTLNQDITGWSGAGVAQAGTDLDANDNYKSETVFTAPSVEVDTNYTITYTIATSAGKSGVQFLGINSTTVMVNDVPTSVTVATVTIVVKAKTSNSNPQFTLEATYTLSNGEQETQLIQTGAVPHAIKKIDVEYLEFKDSFSLSQTAVVGDEVYSYPAPTQD